MCLPFGRVHSPTRRMTERERERKTRAHMFKDSYIYNRRQINAQQQQQQHVANRIYFHQENRFYLHTHFIVTILIKRLSQEERKKKI